MNWLDIKAGSIILDKQYNWFKRTWAKLTKKELPYNAYSIAYYDKSILADEWLILEPRKAYSKAEKKLLLDFAVRPFVFRYDVKDLVLTINSIRDYTFNEFTTVSDLLKNKYYKVVHDPKEQER